MLFTQSRCHFHGVSLIYIQCNHIGTGLMQSAAMLATDQAAGKNVTALAAASADMTAKMADANAQAQAAQNGVSSLLPDQGNATVIASNKAALIAARADIKTSTTDLKAARADIQTILSGLKTLG